MALKKDNLPVNVDVDTEQGSSITYANEVVAIIAGVAASEVEGIAGMCNVSGNLLGKNRAVTKGGFVCRHGVRYAHPEGGV